MTVIVHNSPPIDHIEALEAAIECFRRHGPPSPGNPYIATTLTVTGKRVKTLATLNKKSITFRVERGSA